MNQPASARPIGLWRAWAVALRPRTLSLALVSGLLGVALAWSRQPDIAWGSALAVLALAALMQAITNLQNDIGPNHGRRARCGAPAAHMTGAPTADPTPPSKLGWPRASAQGWLSHRALRLAMLCIALCAAALAWPLWQARGWGVWAIGGLSVVAAWAYMGGPRPIAYSRWGEAMVLVFFGPVAVLGTVWALTGGVDAPQIWPSLAMGAVAALPLVVNNQRDAAHDAAVGRQTFRVRHGAAAGAALYPSLCAVALGSVLAWAWHCGSAWALAPLALAPWAWHMAQALHRAEREAQPAQAAHTLLLPSFGLASAFGGLAALAALAMAGTRP